ncbi:response regulator [Mucilaginibacter conchicola]|uniref:Response regulator n=1 Tax=Mucilaginibacter conchicola TaxID=2303333 RepID=A0A372NPQ7_9SPHI|nr:sigma 54-interacting response regulator [Mucilaginibacter conchicola]RFZ90924.1 response regulator [Mucilaginibacter conchicola]
MPSKLLLVEDQFIQAVHLSNMLEKAGHIVLGVAQSVTEAIELVENQTPDMVLVDILLKGDLTGIDLAKKLNKSDVPFLYISANSNESTLTLAKETEPYGFLVKPYRENDILAALDIAIYRHNQSVDIKTKRISRLQKELSFVIEHDLNSLVGVEHFLAAFHSFIPFTDVVLDVNANDQNPSSFLHLQRSGFNSYKRANSSDFAVDDTNILRNTFGQFSDVFCLDNKQLLALADGDKTIKAFIDLYNISSVVGVPVFYNNGVRGNLLFFSAEQGAYHQAEGNILRSVIPLLTMAFKRIDELNNEGSFAPGALGYDGRHSGGNKFKNIIGSSPKLLFVLDQVSQVAPFETTVIIEGETGVGKEGIADAIHQLSARNKNPVVKINCAAIPRDLIEAELFGYEKGGFTGATERRIGKFEQANGGTIFLDEIGEMPIDVQGKLLRVIQERELERIGGKGTIKIDVRIIAATNRNLYKEVGAGNFRLDLYYRLNVFPIQIPPLRDRKEDIPALAAYFLSLHAEKYNAQIKVLSSKALNQLSKYSWPGNIRELQHVIERHVLISNEDVISSVDLPEEAIRESVDDVVPEAFLSMDELDRAHITSALKKANGKISGKGGAAELLQIPPNSLSLKMKKLGIAWGYLFE